MMKKSDFCNYRYEIYLADLLVYTTFEISLILPSSLRFSLPPENPNTIHHGNHLRLYLPFPTPSPPHSYPFIPRNHRYL